MKGYDNVRWDMKVNAELPLKYPDNLFRKRPIPYHCSLTFLVWGILTATSTHFCPSTKKIWNPFKIWNSSIISLSWLNTVKYYMTHKLVRPHVKSQLCLHLLDSRGLSNSHVVSSALPAFFSAKLTLQKHGWFEVLSPKCPFPYQSFVQRILVTTGSIRIFPSGYLTLICKVCSLLWL